MLQKGLPQSRKLGATLAGFMTQPGGSQVAAVSIDGFDTHANQGAAEGQLAARLAYLDAYLDGLATGLGPAWRDTVVVVATEFGRTARVNGTKGTDHGTGSTALVLGGGLEGRRHHRRLADPGPGAALREPRHRPDAWTCGPCSRACCAITWAWSARRWTRWCFRGAGA